MKYFRDQQHIQSIYDAKQERFSSQKSRFDFVDSSRITQKGIHPNDHQKKMSHAFQQENFKRFFNSRGQKGQKSPDREETAVKNDE